MATWGIWILGIIVYVLIAVGFGVICRKHIDEDLAGSIMGVFWPICLPACTVACIIVGFDMLIEYLSEKI